ncbi:MAG: hypothetical protein KAG61_09405, partial [Bacteriovoracaceae bacterium]|nr:hypothetical protein [Bacteriovoracaceae bacterium]
KHNDTGYVFKLAPESIAQHLEGAISDPNKRADITTRAFNIVAMKFNEKIMVSNIVGLYRKALE